MKYKFNIFDIIVSFIVGVFMTATIAYVVIDLINTNDYQQGYSEGFDQGVESAQE